MGTNTRNAAALLLFITTAASVSAQTAPPDPRSTAERLFYFRLNTVPADTASRDARARELADTLGVNSYALVYYAIPPAVISDSFKDFLQTANKARVDQQHGASPSASAATSAVARTGISSILDAALEAGAISQSVDQNVVTVRTNIDGLVRFLSNQEVFTPCPSGDPDCSASTAFKHVEVAASFNTSDGGTQTLSGTTVPATGTNAGTAVSFSALLNRQQFASATVRYAIMDARDLRSDAYRKKWLAWFEQNRPALSEAGAELLKYVDGVINRIQTIDKDGKPTSETRQNDQYTEWVAATRAALREARPTVEDWQNTFKARLDVLLDQMRKLDPDFDTKLLELSKAFVRYLAFRRDLSATLITDPALTAEFTYAEPQLQPKLYSARVAYAYSPKGTRGGGANAGTVTFNGAVELFQDPQPNGTGLGTSRWKDLQAAVQFDRPLGPANSAGQLSVGAYYQYQINPGIIVIPAGATTLPGTTIPLPASGTPLLGEKGSLFAVQGTLTLRLAGSVRIPIGVSWSNRTELVSGNQVRGHIGISFDTAQLFLLTGLR
jgi:hypothetical protein